MFAQFSFPSEINRGEALQERNSNLIQLESSIKYQMRKIEAQSSMLEKGKEEIQELIQKSSNQLAQIEELEKMKNELQKV